ncbi:hypothetical protein A8L34_25935 [Bacillus sp. FJAT-27264]|uniref:DUF1643 domain-containing protein n=1 Tax=Paenibacillus sp. (strain DSM 101736 / FJAT-27264) TaxID=1850362 RepID=UPI000807FD94|nr:DUF1643 domain-containing protein [Bacillus sp. FJAT-27264]OBZ07576.1 hypothetical protein A8L34_25935 [Bacillus sp. FJAT-27264]
MARKRFYFSSYIDEESIKTNPENIEDEGGLYRYSIRIPFIDAAERSGKRAIVIMKNPSKAGKYDLVAERKLSDDTIYKVLDYLYKHEENFSEVIILNLFALYGSVFNNDLNEQKIYGNGNLEKNNKVISETIKKRLNGDRIVIAWGQYPKKKNFGNNYRKRINQVMKLLDGAPLWRVGDKVKIGDCEFPQHGLQWVDFEKMEPQ